MKYVQINAYSGGWADSIVFERHRKLISEGAESWVFWGRGKHEQNSYMQRIASHAEVCLDALQTRIDGKAGFHSKNTTRRLIKKLEAIDPDVVHLHVLVGYYINVEMLFDWLAIHRCQVVWTLHDCWAFTGHCIYFTYVKCDQWKDHCGRSDICPQIGTYPETICKKSVLWNFEQKKRLFTMLPPERMTLVTPSQWLADLVKLSFLKKYGVEVIHNTINTDVFKPTPSDFRERYGVGDRFMVLGVAAKWSERKGLPDFVKLAKTLDRDKFAVVVVGLSKKQIKQVRKLYRSICHSSCQIFHGNILIRMILYINYTFLHFTIQSAACILKRYLCHIYLSLSFDFTSCIIACQNLYIFGINRYTFSYCMLSIQGCQTPSAIPALSLNARISLLWKFWHYIYKLFFLL